MRLASYVKVVGATTLNIVGYLASGQRYLWLEGRVHRGVFRNWIRGYRYAPVEYRRPTSQAEVVALVTSARSLRVFGSGHSFNEGVVSDEMLVSLDDCAGLVSADAERGQVTVKSGTRVRDVVQILADRWSGLCGVAVARRAEHRRDSLHRRPRHRSRLGIRQRVGRQVDPRGRDRGGAPGASRPMGCSVPRSAGPAQSASSPRSRCRACRVSTSSRRPRSSTWPSCGRTWMSCWRRTSTSASTSTRSARPARSTPGTLRNGRRLRTVMLASWVPSRSTPGSRPRWATFSPTADYSGCPPMCRDCPS